MQFSWPNQPNGEFQPISGLINHQLPSIIILFHLSRDLSPSFLAMRVLWSVKHTFWSVSLRSGLFPNIKMGGYIVGCSLPRIHTLGILSKITLTPPPLPLPPLLELFFFYLLLSTFETGLLIPNIQRILSSQRHCAYHLYWTDTAKHCLISLPIRDASSFLAFQTGVWRLPLSSQTLLTIFVIKCLLSAGSHNNWGSWEPHGNPTWAWNAPNHLVVYMYDKRQECSTDIYLITALAWDSFFPYTVKVLTMISFVEMPKM